MSTVLGTVLCVDVGSTFTKAALVDTSGDAGDGGLLGVASHPTTSAADVLDGVAAVRRQLEQATGRRPDEVLACSSAGGGLRIAVVGYERLVTAEAARRVALSAGGRVVHVHAGPLDVPGEGTAALRESRPDVVLLVGGTDGGNGDVLVHNARRLGIARLPVPVVLAGNAGAAADARAELERRGRTVTVTANVLPRLGVLDPLPARSAIREAFLRHVIGGKGLSRGTAFARLVRAPTPDAVLAGAEVLADGDADAPGAGDLLLVDVGGATTDVYSVLTPQGEDAVPAKDVVQTLWRARTVEADLGMRWGARGVVAASRDEGLADGVPDADAFARLGSWAEEVADVPGRLPADAGEARLDALLARCAVTVALRRHARPATPGGRPRPLRDVRLVVGSGGVLRHATDAVRARVLEPALTDHAGGWRVPEQARLAVDDRYLLFAAGLLAPHDRAAAARLAAAALRTVPHPQGPSLA